PSWANVKTASAVHLYGVLGPGEAEAIALALELKADSILLDETEAREEALRLGLPVSGTIGVLEKAADRDLINLSDAFSRLARTNFYVSPELLQQALQRDAARRKSRLGDREAGR